MYNIKPQKKVIAIEYDEPKTVLNPLQDLHAGFQQMSFTKTKNGLQSADYKSGVSGWRFTAQGNLEANAGTFRGALEANSIDIPDTTTANSFHTDSSGNSWWGATTIGSANAKILNTGVATFANINITGGTGVANLSDAGALAVLNTVGSAQIDALAVNATKIASNAIIVGKIAPNVVTATEIATGTITANEIATGTITSDKMLVSQLSAISADIGSITAGDMTLNSTGFIKGGQTAYETGTGFWLGYDVDAYKFSIGNGTDYFKWDGTNVKMLSSSPNAIIVDHGSDILLKEGGDIKFTSVTAPTACTVALITATGNIDAGTHSYKVTYVNASGETELGTASNTVTNDGTNQQNALTGIPVSTSGSVTSRKIYRTKAGGTYYYLLTTIADNTTTTYTDNVADASLTGGNANNKENNSFGKVKVNDLTVLSAGNKNTMIGQNSGVSNTIGFGNTFTGINTGNFNTEGYRNTANGAWSLYSNTTGILNTATGAFSLYSNTTSSRNTGQGYWSLYSNTTGSWNTAIGSESLSLNTTGNYNTATGLNSLYANTTGNWNMAYGSSALYSNTTGSSNTAIGNVAGANIADGTTGLTTGSNNTFIGSNTKALADGDTNETVIGYDATGIGSNSVVLGNDSVLTTVLKGNVGIGTTSPAEALEVNGGVRLNTATAKPTADATSEGTFWVTLGGSGVADILEICLKSSSDTYSWVSIATG